MDHKAIRDFLRKHGQTNFREGSRAIGHDGPENNRWEDYIEVPFSVLEKIMKGSS